MWIGTEPGFDRQRYTRGFLAARDGKWGTIFVAYQGESLAGYIGVHPREEYGYELGMFVDENFRRQGIGRALLEAAIHWAREKHLPSISLFVFPHNEGALALYRRAGFEEIERYKDDVTRQTGEVWDTILMRKEL